MNRPASPDPLTELLRTTPRGAAVASVVGARAQLHEAATLTAAFLKLILIAMIIPAEALVRRVILALAAVLTRSDTEAAAAWTRLSGTS